MELIRLTAEQLRKAADLQEHIQALQSELARILGAEDTQSTQMANGQTVARSGKARLSAAGRARIAAAARARWAKAKATAQPNPASKQRRTLSAAAKKRLAEVARARWAKVKAAGKSKL